jgi:hypothetical protein
LLARLSGPLQEYPKNALKVPKNACKNMKNRAIKYPVFGVFLPPRNHQTLTNSHFHFLNIRKFSEKTAIFEG